MYELLTRCATEMLIAVIMTVINPITVVVTGHTSAIVTREGKGATLVQGWFPGRVVQACQVIRSQAHSVGATTHPLEIGHWEAEVAAVAIRMGGSITIVRTWKGNILRQWVNPIALRLITGVVHEEQQMGKKTFRPMLKSSSLLKIKIPNLTFKAFFPVTL